LSSVPRGRGSLAIFVAALALCGLTSSRAEAATPPPGFFGVSAPEIYSMSLDGRFALRDAALRQIQAAGIDTVRTEIGWRDVERTVPVDGVHAYDWQAMYRHIAALAEHRQRLTPMIMAPPAWAQDPTSASSCQRRGGLDLAHVDDYVAFVGQVARTFGRDGAYWRWAATNRPAMPQRPITTYEIWNEPNWDSFWCPDIDPETYAVALAKAADAIHAADPKATVSMGGLVVLRRDEISDGHLAGMATKTFLSRIIGAVPDLARRIDAVAVHTYWATPADDLQALSLVETWLDEVGLGHEPLIVSEYGWRTGETAGALSEETRARMIGQLADALARTNCGVIGEYPHNWISPRLDSANPEDWFGLADPLTGAPFASALVYSGVIDSYVNGSASTWPSLDVCTPDPPPPGPARFSVTPPASSGYSSADFAYTATDAASWECRLDGAAWSSCAAGGTHLAGLADGAHTFAARAVNASGTGGAVTYGWTIDTRPAASPITRGPANADTTGPAVAIKRKSKPRAKPVVFSVSATDASGVSRVEYRLDGGPWTTTNGTVSIKAPGRRRHRLEARASDSFDNVGESSVSWRLRHKHRRHRGR
jgi:hypothetical protein